MRRADLHTHTYYSDGNYSPEQLLQKAKKKNISILSVTDHDTVRAYDELEKLAPEYGIKLIPGIELSTEVGEAEVHILGYYFDTKNENLTSYLTQFKLARVERAKKIIERLQENGVPLTFEDVLEEAKSDYIGRPHIAYALLHKGFVRSFQEAFARYLGNFAPYNEKKTELSPYQAIEIIHKAGGVAVLAHPGYLGKDLIEYLLSMDFDGVEYVHPIHNLNKSIAFRETARRKGIIPTGGSDFHGGKRNDYDNFGKFFIFEDTVRELEGKLQSRKFD